MTALVSSRSKKTHSKIVIVGLNLMVLMLEIPAWLTHKVFSHATFCWRFIMFAEHGGFGLIVETENRELQANKKENWVK